MSADPTGEILAELQKISGSLAEQDSRAARYIKELLDKSPSLLRANMYKVYRIDTTTAFATKHLAKVYEDFGYVAAHLLICLDPGGVASVVNIRLNGATNDPLLLSDLVSRYTDGTVGSVGEVKSTIPILGFDIREIFQEVTTGVAGTAKLLVGAWVK